MSKPKDQDAAKELAALRKALTKAEAERDEARAHLATAVAALNAVEYRALGWQVEHVAIQMLAAVLDMDEAQALLAWYAKQDGYLGGRVLPGPRVQSFWQADAPPPTAMLFGVCAAMLPDDMRYVIIPPSQRRALLGERDARA